MFVVMGAMPTVHEQMHQRTGKQNSVGQNLWNMRPMLHKQEGSHGKSHRIDA
jgi:hypothetical protein